MKIFKYIDRLNLIDTLIRQKRTGTPTELAKRVGVSVSGLARIVDNLKGVGAPIAFDRKLKSYYYTRDYAIRINVEIEDLDLKSSRDIFGGKFFFQENSSMLFLCSERK